MKVMVPRWVFLSTFLICVDGEEEVSRCTSIDDYKGINLSHSVCYLSCLSDALNRLYTNGEKKLFVNEEVYANASRILDDMEGKAGESTKYLSVISGVMEGKHDKLEKLISYGNEMGDLVAKVGGLFSRVNESVRAVRKEIPEALIKANKYYTAIVEIARTVWDDVKAVSNDEGHECKKGTPKGVKEFSVTCSNQTCSLSNGVSESTPPKYRGGCLQIDVLTGSGSVSECFNLPRGKLYRHGGVNFSNDVLKWPQNYANRFQITVEVQKIFDPLIALFASGLPPSVLLAVAVNVTSFYSRFKGVHSNFTSVLIDTNLTYNVNSTNSTI
ncbi:expression site-associated gene (ESAG), putative [Trypanosoma equiperdum]|uniref:Expression site-associated gene (ESAG), putative n=1 Tax=Trypanosoma equiperdum TaxID=5694 RepID=A0A1G4IHU8_TRYEQ|nr:expression site-associated gene (ESAG), putative [Trypanosoma equiperdum]